MKIQLANGTTYDVSKVDKTYDVDAKRFQIEVLIEDIGSEEDYNKIVESVKDSSNLDPITLNRESGDITIPGLSLKYITMNIFETKMSVFIIFNYSSDSESEINSEEDEAVSDSDQ